MSSRQYVLLFIAATTLSGLAVVRSQETPATGPAEKADDSQAAREARLARQLTGAVLRGHFQMTNEDGLRGRAPMTPPRAERYEIERLVKSGGDHWVVTARIQYGDRDILVPVPVRIVWAGDTPVITLDEMRIPMIGAYSARVVIDDGFYAGTWRGAGYGGVLSGQIVRKGDEAVIQKLEAEGWTMGTPTSAPATGDGESDANRSGGGA